MLNVPTGLLWSLIAACGVLLVGSAVRFFALRKAQPEIAAQRRSSLLVWWMLFLAMAAALAFGRIGMSLLLCTAGVLGLLEFHHIFKRRTLASPWLVGVVVATGIGYYCVLGWVESLEPLRAFPPLVLLCLSSVQILTGQLRDYVRTTAGYFWMWFLGIVCLSYVVALTHLPASASSFDTGYVGWAIFVILLTEIDDISQALIGRRLGRHKLIPGVSPGKTWEGFLGGMAVTLLLAVGLAPWLTALCSAQPLWQGIFVSLGAGLAISISGLLGDLNISALKREAGVKDSGRALPGMGGILDRVDSLTFTAPALYYYGLLVT